MKKYPKYIVMPIALLIYFIAMTVYGLKMNHWKLQDNFWLICCIELLVIGGLFYILKYRKDKYNH